MVLYYLSLFIADVTAPVLSGDRIKDRQWPPSEDGADFTSLYIRWRNALIAHQKIHGNKGGGLSEINKNILRGREEQHHANHVVAALNHFPPAAAAAFRE